MANSQYKPARLNLMSEVSAALFELRDALMELSLSLKDLQFETDLEKRKNTELSVQQLIQKIASAQAPRSDD